MIRPMLPTDIESVVDIHLAAFAGFFLSSMGKHFLKDFYETTLLDKSSIALISLQGDEISGFAVGTVAPRGFYRRTILKNWQRFLVASIIPILNEPQTALRLFKRLLMTTQSNYIDNQALLMSIAVYPSRQRSGIGKRLIQCFSTEAERRGATSISLITDKLNNDPTNQFYIRSGFICTNSYITSEGRPMNEYRKFFVCPSMG